MSAAAAPLLQLGQRGRHHPRLPSQASSLALICSLNQPVTLFGCCCSAPVHSQCVLSASTSTPPTNTTTRTTALTPPPPHRSVSARDSTIIGVSVGTATRRFLAAVSQPYPSYRVKAPPPPPLSPASLTSACRPTTSAISRLPLPLAARTHNSNYLRSQCDRPVLLLHPNYPRPCRRVSFPLAATPTNPTTSTSALCPAATTTCTPRNGSSSTGCFDNSISYTSKTSSSGSSSSRSRFSLSSSSCGGCTMTALTEAQNGDAAVPAAPPSPRRFQIVVAAFASDSGIGRGGTLPWRRLPNDMALFKEITLATEDKQKQEQKQRPMHRQRRNAVVMGRKTFDSIPPKFRPLPGRLNVVLSRQRRRAGEGEGEGEGLDLPEGVLHAGSLEEALRVLGEEPWVDEIERVFVIGGAQVYREALESPHCEAIHITHVFPRSDAEEASSPPPPCDTFFPQIPRETFRVWCTTPKAADGDEFVTSFTCFIRCRGSSQKQQKQNGSLLPQQPSGDANGSNGNHTAGTKAQAEVVGGEAVAAAAAEAGAVLPRVVRERHEEYQYLRLVDDILATGTRKGDRTGTGTIAKFGCQLLFDLRETFPLLTTKRVFWRGVVEELLWFVAGSTNANLLKEKGVHIWDGNGSRAFLDSLGFTEREEGDLGPVYGFQWRHFGAEYTHMHASYEGQGVDQLADVVRKIRHTPNDRRIVLSSWNPSHLHLMALPPCHLLAQFFVADGALSCQMYQRSCDTGLGVPFNIASYALLTHMLAHVCGLVPGEFVHVLGDAHVYSNHIMPLKQQLKNMPRPFPVLKIRRAVKEIDEFQFDDFELEGYEPHKKIAMEMAV